MTDRNQLVTALGVAAVFLLLFGLFSWRQYLKFTGGRGIARWLLPSDAPVAVQVAVFVAIPLVAAVVAGWSVGRRRK